MVLLKNLEVLGVSAFINAHNITSAIRRPCMHHLCFFFFFFFLPLTRRWAAFKGQEAVLFPKAIHLHAKFVISYVFDRIMFLCNRNWVHLLNVHLPRKDNRSRTNARRSHGCPDKAVVTKHLLISLLLMYQMDVKVFLMKQKLMMSVYRLILH